MLSLSKHARRAFRLLGAILAGLVLVLLLFAVCGWVGSSIPRNGDSREPERGIEIMVGTNGVHTELVMPLVTPEKDWRGDFPAADLAQAQRGYTHVAVSWGEREVFLNTPTWWDLSPMTVLRIAGVGGEGLLHVAHYVRPAPGDDIRPLRLTSVQYRALVAQIEAMLPPGRLSEPRTHYPGYDYHDTFYPARGTYSTGNTCNQWTSDTLAAAGVRTGTWTPFAGGVMKWVP